MQNTIALSSLWILEANHTWAILVIVISWLYVMQSLSNTVQNWFHNEALGNLFSVFALG